MQKQIWYWHIHHDTLIEQSNNIKERIDYIKANKPKNEIKIRLRLLKRAYGIEPIWQDYAKIVNQAKQDYDKIVNPSKQDHEKIVNQAWQDFDKIVNQSRQDFDKIVNQAKQDYDKIVDKLHKGQCKNCSWNGQTIFKVVD